LVIVAPVVPHFNKHIWGPTADAFDPDRFDNLPKAAQDPYAQQAFSSGPRICVGKSMAVLEFKALLVEFVRNFEFANTGLIEPQKGGISLRPLNGLRLHIWPAKKD
jgi:cytochrome P450